MTTFLEDSDRDLYQPPREDATIWRYMSLAKFVSMVLPLQHDTRLGGLRLSRLDTLGDPHEGSGPSAGGAAEASDELAQTQTTHYVSSWHLNEVESAALWRLYGGGEGTIAVQSTYGRLRASLASDLDIGIGSITYTDAADESLEFSPVARLLRKRLSFEYEQELRVIARDESGPDGLLIPVDLDTLIEAIYIAPFDGEWVGDTVRRLLRTLGRDYPVRESAI